MLDMLRGSQGIQDNAVMCQVRQFYGSSQLTLTKRVGPNRCLRHREIFQLPWPFRRLQSIRSKPPAHLRPSWWTGPSLATLVCSGPQAAATVSGTTCPSFRIRAVNPPVLPPKPMTTSEYLHHRLMAKQARAVARRKIRDEAGDIFARDVVEARRRMKWIETLQREDRDRSEQEVKNEDLVQSGNGIWRKWEWADTVVDAFEPVILPEGSKRRRTTTTSTQSTRSTKSLQSTRQSARSTTQTQPTPSPLSKAKETKSDLKRPKAPLGPEAKQMPTSAATASALAKKTSPSPSRYASPLSKQVSSTGDGLSSTSQTLPLQQREEITSPGESTGQPPHKKQRIAHDVETQAPVHTEPIHSETRTTSADSPSLLPRVARKIITQPIVQRRAVKCIPAAHRPLPARIPPVKSKMTRDAVIVIEDEDEDGSESEDEDGSESEGYYTGIKGPLEMESYHRRQDQVQDESHESDDGDESEGDDSEEEEVEEYDEDLAERLVAGPSSQTPRHPRSPPSATFSTTRHTQASQTHLGHHPLTSSPAKRVLSDRIANVDDIGGMLEIAEIEIEDDGEDDDDHETDDIVFVGERPGITSLRPIDHERWPFPGVRPDNLIVLD